MSTHFTRAAALALALASCGDATPTPAGSNDYTLRGAAVYPTRVTAGASVRTLILRAENRAGPMMRDLRCGYSFVLFDVTRASTQAPVATGAGGDCALYMTPPEADYAGQRWECAGGIRVASGDIDQLTGFCPEAGSAGPWEGEFRTCGGFLSAREAAVSSADEIGMDDRVTDLMGAVRFPTQPVVSAPTTLPVTTWPAAGADLTVAWNSLEATNAMVRVEPDDDTRRGPVIVCTPRTNGRITVDAALLDRSGLRAMAARLRVWSFRETTVQAGGRAWNLAGASGTRVLLQPPR